MLRGAFISRSAEAAYLGAMHDPTRVLLAALTLMPGLAGFAWAADDHELAREALTSGQIRPLGEIVNAVQSRCQGKIIEVELERSSRDGADFWLYQLRMMMPKGDILRLDVDARTTQILKVKGQGAKGACHAGS